MGGKEGLTCNSNRFYFIAVKKCGHEKYVVRTLLSTPLREIIRSSLILWHSSHPISDSFNILGNQPHIPVRLEQLTTIPCSKQAGWLGTLENILLLKKLDYQLSFPQKYNFCGSQN